MNQESQKKSNVVLFIGAVILVTIFFISWYVVATSLTVKQNEAHERNDSTITAIDKMTCDQLRYYIADHKYLYSYASQRYHGGCE